MWEVSEPLGPTFNRNQAAHWRGPMGYGGLVLPRREASFNWTAAARSNGCGAMTRAMSSQQGGAHRQASAGVSAIRSEQETNVPVNLLSTILWPMTLRVSSRNQPRRPLAPSPRTRLRHAHPLSVFTPRATAHVGGNREFGVAGDGNGLFFDPAGVAQRGLAHLPSESVCVGKECVRACVCEGVPGGRA